ncbi:hypothetical protein M2324_001476 [Rhodovulum sulfidophilum]|uniref:hypothetical protein n=1 Tax=Rhodovulum sulfidophilum TaxID=35806 RepID=UPI0005A765F7|nr:hypothetical protein [Rhodovulum sulfidophilum]ANB33578.1 hypothetical protein A6W98_05500 [Rhodovulum sulfidophilum DSM 1374]ANB37399.1 hypothetical protein A6024_05350 [Rhodovulum sulfidophilum]MCW2303086.1 hypothetical protein [Rhodovulum sulfidophilum]
MTPEAALPLGMDTAAIRIALRGRNRRPPKKGHKRRQGQPARHPGQGPKAHEGLPGPRFPENRIGRAIQRMDPVDFAAALHPFPGRPVAARSLPRPTPMIGNARTRWTLPQR